MNIIVTILITLILSPIGGLIGALTHNVVTPNREMAVGVPNQRYERTMLPETTNTYDFGSLSRYWANTYASSSTAGAFYSTSTSATSTFANGISLTGGCFKINGVCISSATGVTGSGILNALTYWTGASIIGATSSQPLYVGSLFATTTGVAGASTLQNFTFTNSTGTGATTTSLAVTGVANALMLTNGGGSVGAYGGSSCTNQFPRSVSSAGSWTCASVANTDLTNSSLTVTAGSGLAGGGSVALGSSVTLTNPYQISTTSPSVGGVAYFSGVTPTSLASVATGTISASGGITVTASRYAIGGAVAIACTEATAANTGCLSSADWTTFNNKLSSYDAWTHPTAGISATTSGMIFTNASSTFTGNLNISGNATVTNATTTNFAISTISSAIMLTNGNGSIAAYAGAGCTNQVVKDISALGAPTCVSINNNYWSGTALAVGNGGTGLSTFGGTNRILYTTAANTLVSDAAFTYNQTTGLFTVVNSSTTNLTTGSYFQAPNNASLTLSNSAGSIGVDTTLGQFLFNTNRESVVLSGTSTIGRSHATTTTTGTTTYYLIKPDQDVTVVRLRCYTNTGTSRFDFYNGTASSSLNCSTTDSQSWLTSNNKFGTSTANVRIGVGTQSTAAQQTQIMIDFKRDQY